MSISRQPVKILLTIISLGIAVFWVWALFFPPSRDNVAAVDDTSWSIRANALCQEANLQRDTLVDLRRINTVGPNALSERADIIDEATASIQKMLDDVTSQQLASPQDQKRVDTWRDIFQDWINGRIAYTAILRTGENAPFAESMVEGSPASTLIDYFAQANRMKSCGAPKDLAV